jgi:phosphoenolpyruvate-protein kinase (PTS system EI component)
MGIRCVNGVARAVVQLRDGDVVLVDGHLGVVTVGPPEFDLELARPQGRQAAEVPESSRKRKHPLKNGFGRPQRRYAP